MHKIAGLLLCLAACSSPPAGPGARVEPSAAPPTPAPTPTPSVVEAPAPHTPPEVPPPNWQAIPEKRAGGFPGVDFVEVRGFALDLHVNGPPQCGLPLDADGTLCRTVERPGAQLSSEQTQRLLALLKQPASFGGGANCYLPHHAFVFYDAAGTPVAELAVCFLCNMMVAMPAVPATKRSGGDELGITDKTNEALRKLCNELGLPMCDAKHPDEFGKPTDEDGAPTR